jgi:hypothetical protein
MAETPYEVWVSFPAVLEEVAKTGLAAIPFLTDLLTLPCYQKDFAVGPPLWTSSGRWTGFGAEQSSVVQRTLALQAFNVATDPQEKLSKLRPLFDLTQFEVSLGYDPESLLEKYMDRGLAAAETTGPNVAVPFLRSLLNLPQFQENYSSLNRITFGHDQRAKVQAAIARLQRKQLRKEVMK